MPSERPAREDTVRSVDRAVTLLQVIAERGPLGVSELAQVTGTHKSTVFRLLVTLENRGLVEQARDRGEYGLGYGVVQLARGATRRHDLTVVSRPTCRRLADAVGETVTVAIHDGAGVVTVDQQIGPSALTTVDWVGTRAALHVSAAGKVFLAHASPGDLELPERLERLTDRTITRRSDLDAELAEVRRLGWSRSVGEQEDGLTAVAAPVHELGGGVVAAVGVSGPSFRLEADALPGVAAQVVAAADEISWRNGAPKRG